MGDALRLTGLVFSVMGLLFLFSCRQPDKPYRYEKSDTTLVRSPSSFIYNSDKDSLFDEFIADIIDKSKFTSLQNEKLTCIFHTSKDRNAIEATGKELKLWLKNDADSVCRLSVNGKEIKLTGMETANLPKTLGAHYKFNCNTLRNFSFNGKQYTHFKMIDADCFTLCMVYNVLYDHANNKVTVFADLAYGSYFLLGDINADGRLDYLSINAVPDDDITLMTVYTQGDGGGFKQLKNDKDEPVVIRVRLYRDEENNIYQVDLLTIPPF